MIHAAGDPALQGKMKRASLVSTAGAGILGGGLGVLLAPWVGPYGVALVLLGVALHAWGMRESHRLEAGAPRVWWAEALYWVCWVALIVIGGLVLVRG